MAGRATGNAEEAPRFTGRCTPARSPAAEGRWTYLGTCHMTPHSTTVKGAIFAEFDRATRPKGGGGDGEDRLVGSVDLAPLMKSRVYSRPKRPLPPAGPPTPHVGGSGPNEGQQR